MPTPARPRRRPSAWRPDRTSMAPRATVTAALGAGAVAAVALDPSVVSIAYLLTGAAVAATAFVTVVPRPTPAQVGALLAALALLAVAGVRGADWLAVVCVVASWMVGSVALVGGRTWTGLALASVALWCTPARLVGWVRRGRSRHARESTVRPGRVLAVAAVSTCLVLLFGALFVSADPEFGRLFERVVPAVGLGNPLPHLVIGVLVAGAALAATYLRRRSPRFDSLAPAPARPLARWEWAVPLALLDLLFAAFVAVQLRVLFGGDGHVLGTDGLTYADYARQGFWQLSAVTVLTLLVIAVVVRRIDTTARRDRRLARVALGPLCVLTLLVVASAVHRMALYESAFGFTRLRLGVMAAELWLGVVFVALLVAGVRMTGHWLPRAVLASAVVGTLAFAAINPDGYIADRNVQRYTETGNIDVAYLRGLSVDAVPALDRLPEPVRSCALRGIGVGGDASGFAYNAARSRAAQILRERPVGPCDFGQW
ncbi:DUF4153 domain-containing protein [Rhodococcus kronopolitis]|uniref:DUF4153 domain-containing protein n=1 Tax=Rhodococcus kronopolitis TaxID=1460226 RepID=A0ABV9FMF6_9NOCA